MLIEIVADKTCGFTCITFSELSHKAIPSVFSRICVFVCGWRCSIANTSPPNAPPREKKRRRANADAKVRSRLYSRSVRSAALCDVVSYDDDDDDAGARVYRMLGWLIHWAFL